MRVRSCSEGEELWKEKGGVEELVTRGVLSMMGRTTCTET